MAELQLLMNEYMKSELLILLPVLYVAARILHNTNMNEKKLPFVLLAISIVMCACYVFGTSQTQTLQEILMALFTSIVQGVLLCGTSIYGGIIFQIMGQQKSNK